MKQFFWLVSAAGAFFGSVTLMEAFTADSAPKQAAAAAMAAALAIIPYCFARAIAEISSSATVATQAVVDSRMTGKQLLKGFAVIALIAVIGAAIYVLRIVYS